MSMKCLFIVNGLGLGNSTRCFAIMEHLKRASVDVHVLTSGNGYFFFADKPEVTSVTRTEAIHYGKTRDGRLSVMRTFLNIAQLWRAYKAKTAQLNLLLDRIKPDVVVADSDYFVFPVRKRKIPLIGLNNSDVVVTEYLRRANKPSSIRPQFWCIEFMDYLFHRKFFDVILSPAADPVPVRHPKFRRIGLVVREQLLTMARRSDPSGAVSSLQVTKQGSGSLPPGGGGSAWGEQMSCVARAVHTEKQGRRIQFCRALTPHPNPLPQGGRESVVSSARSVTTGNSTGERRPRKLPLVVFMLSGSFFSSDIDFSHCGLPCTIEVVGRSGQSTENVTYHGKLIDNTAKLMEADVLVINAGFSAVSEALALGKPTLVLPVPNHAEQYINSCLVEDCGLGQRVDEHTVLPALRTMLLSLEDAGSRGARMSPPVNPNGAAEAASIILDVIQGSSRHVKFAA